MLCSRFFRFAAAFLLAFIMCSRRPVLAAPATLPYGPATEPARMEELAQLEDDLIYFAGDAREGRGIGTRGLDESANYISDRFRKLGLAPLPGMTDYFEPFEMSRGIQLDPSTALLLADQTLKRDHDFSVPGISSDGAFDGGVVFAGYGITDAAHNYDDYTGLDVHGKIVLVLRFEPHNEKGTSRFADNDWSPDAALGTKAATAAAHGAAAILLVNPPKFHGRDQLVPVSRVGAAASIPFLHITRAQADQLLKVDPDQHQTLEALQQGIDASGQPHSFAIAGATARGTIKLDRGKVQVKNVIAMLPGEKNDEFVIVGAHYDHLGHGGEGSLAPGSTEIHNGADDNASGTTTVLDLAERLARGKKPKRSIIFMTFTGEEEGLVGSEYFVNHLPIKLEQIVAMLNLDMVGRLRNDTLYTGGTGTAANFDALVHDSDAQTAGLTLKDIGRGGRGPSDHQSFGMKHVPVLFYFTGLHSDYHTPGDDAEKINYIGMLKIADLSERTIAEMCAMPRPEYIAKFDGEPLLLGTSGGSGARVTLGVVPDYGADESTGGVKISGTTPGSPAESAGLRGGDVITQINARKIENLYDLTELLASAKVDQDVTIHVLRDQKPLELHATLAERKG